MESELDVAADSTAEPDCGCGKAAAGGEGAELGEIGEPSVEGLEMALAGALAETGADELELATAGLDQLLSAEEELAFAGIETADAPTIESIVALAERYPGLKITLSF